MYILERTFYGCFSVLHSALDAVEHARGARHVDLFVRVREGGIESAHTHYRSLEAGEARLLHGRRHLCSKPTCDGCLVRHEAPSRLEHASVHSGCIPGQKRTQIDDFTRHPQLLLGALARLLHNKDLSAVGHDGDVGALQKDLSLPKGQHVVLLGHLLDCLAVQALRLKEDYRIGVAYGAEQQAFCLGGGAWHDNFEARRVREVSFRRL
mmetsp:Transcript_57647/g.141362  ORF Transcript_57647/g.141362 Transcript_57647/m.141362 type:complete len:209 (+) Transcript_57647:69-695(+)